RRASVNSRIDSNSALPFRPARARIVARRGTLAVRPGYPPQTCLFPTFRETAAMRRICVSLALLAIIVVLGHTSAQQPDFQAMMKVGRSVQRVVGDNPGFLAANPGVQKELKMDDDQIKAVREKVPAGLGFGGFGGFGKGKELTDEQKERAAKMMEKFQALM